MKPFSRTQAQKTSLNALIIVFLMGITVIAWSVPLAAWQEYLIKGILLFCLMAFSGIALSRAGRSPYWAIFVVVPYFIVALFWLFAFCRWPKAEKADKIRG